VKTLKIIVIALFAVSVLLSITCKKAEDAEPERIMFSDRVMVMEHESGGHEYLIIICDGLWAEGVWIVNLDAKGGPTVIKENEEKEPAADSAELDLFFAQ